MHEFAADRWNWAFAKARGRRRDVRMDELERLVALRHLGGGPHFGGGPMFGGGRGRARRGDVRLALLLLLAEEPRNGYQLMQEIEERSGGRWRPSPGSVYPALAQLEDEALVRSVEREGVGRAFEITDAGREQLAGRPADAEPPWVGDEDPAELADLKGQLKAFHIAAAQVLRAGNEEQIARAAEILAEARRSLYRILAEEPNA